MVFGVTIRTWLPYLNFTVATSALVFQTTVLYPWHAELEHSFDGLKREHVQQLQIYHEIKLKKLEELEKRVVAMEKTRGWEERVDEKPQKQGWFRPRWFRSLAQTI